MELLSDCLEQGSSTYKNMREAGSANSTRKLANEVRKEIPELVRAAKDNFESLSRLSDAATYATIEKSNIYREMADSTIQLNQTLERAAAVGANALEEAVPIFEGASEIVVQSVETVAGSAKEAAKHMEGLGNSAKHVAREVHGIQVIGNSLVDHINYYGRWMQTVSAIQVAQGYQALRVLTDISQHLGEHNSITVSGSGGPDGFAQHVYDFVKQRIDEIESGKEERHRFFVYHPDTDWYGAFHRLIKQSPLPPTFCAKADDLDNLCRYMMDIRAQLNEESERGKDIVFHLLIPSWYRVSVKEPLHFPDELQPFRVEGRKHKGKPLIELNLPEAPAKLLHGVANVLDAQNQDAIARGVSVAVTLPAVGWGVNGACLAVGLGLGALTGLGALVAAPVWICTAPPAMSVVGQAMDEAIYNALCEEAPRVLGSNRRLRKS